MSDQIIDGKLEGSPLVELKFGLLITIEVSYSGGYSYGGR